MSAGRATCASTSLQQLAEKVRGSARQIECPVQGPCARCDIEHLRHGHFLLVEELVACVRRIDGRVDAEFAELERQKRALEARYDGSDASRKHQIMEHLDRIGDQWQLCVNAVAQRCSVRACI